MHSKGQSKKLTDAVEHLLGGGKVNSDLLADAEAYGIAMPDELMVQQHHTLWAEHKAPVELFARCMTQWRSTAAGVIGLDYGVVLQIASLYQIGNPAKVLEDLQIMELHAIKLIRAEAG